MFLSRFLLGNVFSVLLVGMILVVKKLLKDKMLLMP